MRGTLWTTLLLLLSVYGAPFEKRGAKQKHFVVQKEDISAVEKELKEQAGENKKFDPTSAVPLLPVMQVDGLADKPTKAPPKGNSGEAALSSTNPPLDGSDVILSAQDEQFLDTIAQTLKEHPELLDTLANADSTEIIEEIARIGEQNDKQNRLSKETEQRLVMDGLQQERSRLTGEVGELELTAQEDAAGRFNSPIQAAAENKYENSLSEQQDYPMRHPVPASRPRSMTNQALFEPSRAHLYDPERELSSLGNSERYRGLHHSVQKKAHMSPDRQE